MHQVHKCPLATNCSKENLAYYALGKMQLSLMWLSNNCLIVCQLPISQCHNAIFVALFLLVNCLVQIGIERVQERTKQKPSQHTELENLYTVCLFIARLLGLIILESKDQCHPVSQIHS